MKTKLIKLGLLCLLSIPVISFAAVQYDTVYADEFSENWYSGSWGGNTNNIQSTTNPYAGSHCIEIDYTDWGSFGFDHREEYWAERYYYYPNQYQYINFYFNPGVQVNQITYLMVTLDLEKSVKIMNYIDTTIIANTWYNVRIPINDINPDNKKFFRLYFSNESSILLPHIYIDNICLEYISDPVPPFISNLKVTEIGQDAAVVTWDTDEPVSYVLRYKEYVDGSNANTITSEEYEPGGSVKITNLEPLTAYEIEVECSDHQRDQGTPSNSSDMTIVFATIAPDTVTPAFSDLRIIDTYSNRVIIGWTTDEPSTTKLEYGINNYNTIYTDSLYSRTHTVVLTHLNSNTQYQFRVSSTDKYNNVASIEDTPAKTFSTAAKVDGPDRWIVTDHPIYQWDEVGPDEVPWKMITHLNLGQLWPVPSDSGYTLGIEPDSYWSDEWGGFEKWKTEAGKYITSGHNAGRKIICMLGGAGSNPDGQWNDATSDENIKVFAQNIRKVLEGIGFDGTDIDWEDDIHFPSFINLAKELREAWPAAIITIPTGLNGDDAFLFAPANDYVDAFTPMSYYPIPQWGGWLIPVPMTPLYPAGDNPYGIEYTRNKWMDEGVPVSKLIMGVGGFGSVWGDSNEDGFAPVRPYVNTDDLNGAANSETESMGSDNLVSWTFVHNVLEANPDLYEGWDETGLCTYWHTGDSSKQIQVLYPGRTYYLDISLIFYETARSMSEKVEYIEAQNMKGVGYWTLSQLMYNGYSPVLDVASCMLLDTSKVIEPVDTTEVTGIRPTLSNLTIAVYPNPVSETLHIDHVNADQGLQMRMVDCLGRMVCRQDLTEENNIVAIPEIKGVLVVIITDKSGNIILNRKIMKL